MKNRKVIDVEKSLIIILIIVLLSSSLFPVVSTVVIAHEDDIEDVEKNVSDTQEQLEQLPKVSETEMVSEIEESVDEEYLDMTYEDRDTDQSEKKVSETETIVNDSQSELVTEVSNQIKKLTFDDILADFGGRKYISATLNQSGHIVVSADEEKVDRYQLDATFEEIQDNSDAFAFDLVNHFEEYQNKSSEEILNQVSLDLKSLLLVKTYFDRWYSIKIGEEILSEQLYFNKTSTADILEIADLVKKDNGILQSHLTGRKYRESLKQFFGYPTVVELVESFIEKETKSDDYDSWFKTYFKGSIYEIKSKFDQLNLSTWEKVKNNLNRTGSSNETANGTDNLILPLLTVKQSENLMLGNGPGILIYSTHKRYGERASEVMDKTLENFNHHVNLLIDTHSEEQKKEIVNQIRTIPVYDSERYSVEIDGKKTNKANYLDKDNTLGHEFYMAIGYLDGLKGNNGQASPQGITIQAGTLETHSGGTLAHEYGHSISHILLGTERDTSSYGYRQSESIEIIPSRINNNIEEWKGLPWVTYESENYSNHSSSTLSNSPNRFQKPTDLQEYFGGYVGMVYALNFVVADVVLDLPLEEQVGYIRQWDDEKRGIRSLTIDEIAGYKLKTVDDLVDHKLAIVDKSMKDGEAGYPGYLENYYTRYSLYYVHEDGEGSDKSAQSLQMFDSLMSLPQYEGWDAVRLYFSKNTTKWSTTSLETLKIVMDDPEIDFVKFRKMQLNENGSLLKSNGFRYHTYDDVKQLFKGQMTNLEKVKTDLYKEYLLKTNEFREEIYLVEKDVTLWGTSPWSFEEASGVLTIEAGELSSVEESPWQRKDGKEIPAEKIKKIVFTGKVKAPSNSTSLFANLSNVETIEGLIDTSNVINMSLMFDRAYSLTSVDVSTWNTSNVTNMSSMFQDARSLNSANISDWDTSKVIDMNSMFGGARSLTSVDVSDWDTSKVMYMNAMFANASSLTRIDINGWDTSNVLSMSFMFTNTKLVKLTLGEKFKFVEHANLGAPQGLVETDTLTGNWVREDGQSKGYSPLDFMANYGTEDLTPGTYVAEIERPLWGTSPWSFEEASGVLTIEAGELSNAGESPWQRKDGREIPAEKIKKIVFTGEVKAPVNSQRLLAVLFNTEKIEGLNNINTSNVTNMNSMFDRALSLSSVDVSGWDTSNVTTMDSMFISTLSLTSVDVSGWDMSNVTNMSSMFQEASSLTSVDVSKWDTSKVMYMSSMFGGARSLTSVDVSKWDMSNVTNLGGMFEGASSLTSVDVSKWNTSRVTSTSVMFRGASSLTSLDVSGWDMSNVTHMYSMFSETKLTKLILGEKFKFGKIFGLSAELGAPQGLVETDILTGNWIREDGQSKGYSPEDFMENYGTGDLTPGTYVAEKLLWGTSPWSFEEASGVLTIGAGELSIVGESPWNRADDYKIASTDIKKIVFTGEVKAPSNSTSLFANLSNVETIEGLIDTSNVINMSLMFGGARSLTSVDVSKWNTSNVTSMSQMFRNASSLSSVDVSEWDMSKVTSMSSMFNSATSLTSVDVSKWNTSKVTFMNSMFQNARSLPSVDVSKWDTSSVTTMSQMFSETNLIKLTLGENFKFVGDANLGAPQGVVETDILTGNWIREDGQSKGYSPVDFMANYGTGDLTPGTYVAEIDIEEEFKFKEVPEYFVFEESKVSNKTQEIQRKETDLKMVVQDTRKTKNEWRITAQLATPFKTSNGDLLMDILYYRIAGQKDQLIGMTDAVTVFTSDGTDSSLIDVQWNEGEGPFLKVAPGMAKRGQYQCEIQWALIDAPA